MRLSASLVFVFAHTLVLPLVCLGEEPEPTASDLSVSRLRCEYHEEPLGIDEEHPRFTWLVSSTEQGQKQTAYQILVATSREELLKHNGNVWDTGKFQSNKTVNVAYAGPALESQTEYYWKVRAWDRSNKASDWSAIGRWSMGILNSDEWSAKFISYRDETPVFTDREELFLPSARQYRREFEATKRVRRATIYASALGIYELHLNGRRVGDAYFAPGWTDYRQRAYYQTYDVTNLLIEGENAVGIWLADGWYSGYVGFGLLTGIGTEKIGRYTYGKTPSVMMQLAIEYDDGTIKTVGTDKSWRVTGEGPIREADFLMGETYDATSELDGWNRPGFNDNDWEHAILAVENGQPNANFCEFQDPTQPGEGARKATSLREIGFIKPKLQAFPGSPVRVTEELPCVSVTQRPEGSFLFDLGQNFAGVYRLNVTAPKGQRLCLRFGEMLHPDGRLMTENLRKARATDYYVCRGAPGGEVYSPRFTFHGFRYVEIEGLPSPPAKVDLTGLVLHSDTPLASSFECSDPVVNRLFKNIVWTQRANFIDLPTDCPQRDERMGWTGDAQVYVGSAAYNADVSAFYTKWLRELMESQRPSGVFPGYAPFPYQHGHSFGTAWCDAGVICPWTIWRVYDDTRVIEACWQSMTKFMEWRKRTSKNYLGVTHGNKWGDWLAQGEETPLDYIDTVYFAISTRMMAEMAEATNRKDEAVHYRRQLRNIRDAFADKYLQPNGTIAVDSQTAYALAFQAQLVPESLRPAVGQTLANKIESNGNRMTTGFLGTCALLPALTTVGNNDLATFLLQSRTFPSWGYEVEQGATTIWERWDSYTKKDGFGRHNASMNSYAHYAFGAVCEWMFDTLAGIRPGAPGYQRIIIRPTPPMPGSNADYKPISWVTASHDSIRGRITSKWRIEDDDFLLEVDIPTNTTARIIVPTPSRIGGLTVDGVTVEHHKHARLDASSDERLTTIDIESGHYQIRSRNSIRHAATAHSARNLEPEKK